MFCLVNVKQLLVLSTCVFDMPSKSQLFSLQILLFSKFSANLINCNLFWASIKCSFSNLTSNIFCFSRSSFYLSNLSFAWIASNSPSVSFFTTFLSPLEDDLEDLKYFEDDWKKKFKDFDFELWLRLDFDLKTSRFCSCWEGRTLLWTSFCSILNCFMDVLVAATLECCTK